METTKASRKSNKVESGRGPWGIVAGLVAIGGCIAYYILAPRLPELKNLVNASDDILRQTLTGTLPYLFYCQDGVESPPSVFLNLMQDKRGTLDFANLNCSQVLPSGKTILQKFGLKKKGRNAVIFGTAPWAKPQQVPKASLVDVKALNSFIEIAFAPNPKLVSSDKEFHSFCGFAKDIATAGYSVTSTCVLLMRGMQHSKYHADLEQKIVRSFPRTKVAVIDAKSRRLSFEARQFVPVDEFSLMVHSVRNGTHFLRMSEALTWDYVNMFISESIALPLHQFDADPHGKVSIIKSKASSKFKDRSQSAGSSSDSGSSSKSGSGKRAGRDENDDNHDNEHESSHSSSSSGSTMAEELAKRKRQEDRKDAREFARKAQQKQQQQQQHGGSRQESKSSHNEEDDDYSDVGNDDTEENPDEDIIEL